MAPKKPFFSDIITNINIADEKGKLSPICSISAFAYCQSTPYEISSPTLQISYEISFASITESIWVLTFILLLRWQTLFSVPLFCLYDIPWCYASNLAAHAASWQDTTIKRHHHTLVFNNAHYTSNIKMPHLTEIASMCFLRGEELQRAAGNFGTLHIH